ncbi:MAG: MerR family transcriptional regulator [Armatimonadota bacterium]|nr:MerR family transcriptional regulator [Armatimonadota bacterium]
MPVYHISIVAEMVETHPQTLRMYERMGLVAPRRTRNNIRLYSDADVEQVRRIQHLTQDLGVNLAGVEVVFKLLREMYRMQEEIEGEIEAVRAEAEAAIEAAWREATQGNGKRK